MNPVPNATLAKTFGEFLNDPARKAAIAKVAPTHITPERLIRIAQNAVNRNPRLLECEPFTVYASIIQSAELGLEPNGALGQAYLVPFKNGRTQRMECQLIPGYQGYVELMYRSGRVLDIHADVVCDGEEFDYDLGRGTVRHRKMQGERKAEDVVYAYFVAHLVGGGTVIDVLTRWELDQRRARSKARDDGPWKTDTLEMYRKTVVRHGCKLVPRSVEISKLLSADNAIDTGDPSLAEYDADIAIDADFTEEPTKGNGALKKKMGVQEDEEQIGTPPPDADERLAEESLL